MQTLSWMYALLVAVFVWSHGGAQLTVVLEETRAGGISPTVVLIVDETRSFNLVPGLTYHIHCSSLVGFGGLSEVWQDGEGNAIEIMSPAPALDFDQTAVYSTLRDPDNTNEWSLVLQRFSQQSTGTYVCQSAEGEGGTDAVLVIGMSNPTIILNIAKLNLRAGFHTERPSLRALASSNPLPNRTRWLFQDQELVNGNGIIVSIVNNTGEVLLPQNIESSIAGDYVFRMESGAGTVSATLTVVVESPPSPPQQPRYSIIQYGVNDFTAAVEWSPASDGGVGIDNYTLTGAGITAPLTVLSNEPLMATLTLSYNEMHVVSITASNTVGESSAAVVTIHEVGCDLPIPPPRGSLGGLTSLQEGTVVTFQCSPGFVPPQQMMSVCAANGSWTPDPAELECKIDCGDPSPPMNGFVMAYDSTLEDSQIVFQCSPGFVPSQQMMSVCLTNGRWSPDPAGLVCRADCGIPIIVNGSVNYTTTVEGSIATYQCGTGLVPEGVTTAICMENGDWDPDPADAGCRRPASCGAPPSPASGSVEFTTTLEGSIAAFQCDTGLVPEELFAAVCIASGEWAPNPSGLSCGQPESDSQGLSTIVVVGIAVASTFFVSFTAGLLVASVIAYCYIRQKVGQYSPKVSQQPDPTYENVPMAINNPTPIEMSNPVSMVMNNPPPIQSKENEAYGSVNHEYDTVNSST